MRNPTILIAALAACNVLGIVLLLRARGVISQLEQKNAVLVQMLNDAVFPTSTGAPVFGDGPK